MARPLRIEFPGALHHVTSRGSDRRRIIRDAAAQQKRVERLRWERCQPRSTPQGHGPAQLSRSVERIFKESDDTYSLFTA